MIAIAAYMASMGIDACAIGFCNFYDSGTGVFQLVLGIAIGALGILLIQRFGKRGK